MCKTERRLREIVRHKGDDVQKKEMGLVEKPIIRVMMDKQEKESSKKVHHKGNDGQNEEENHWKCSS